MLDTAHPFLHLTFWAARISPHFSRISALRISKKNSSLGLVWNLAHRNSRSVSTHWCQEIGNLSAKILRKFEFLKSHCFMINIRCNEQKIWFYHTIMVQEAYYYLGNNIKRIITQHLLSSKFGSLRKWQSCRLGRKVYSALHSNWKRDLLKQNQSFQTWQLEEQ